MGQSGASIGTMGAKQNYNFRFVAMYGGQSDRIKHKMLFGSLVCVTRVRKLTKLAQAVNKAIEKNEMEFISQISPSFFQINESYSILYLFASLLIN